MVACNDKAVLDRNLLASDMVQRNDIETYVEYGAGSASVDCNRGIGATKAPIIVFAHQDVYFPPAWCEVLNAEIARVESIDPNRACYCRKVFLFGQSRSHEFRRFRANWQQFQHCSSALRNRRGRKGVRGPIGHPPSSTTRNIFCKGGIVVGNVFQNMAANKQIETVILKHRIGQVGGLHIFDMTITRHINVGSDVGDIGLAFQPQVKTKTRSAGQLTQPLAGLRGPVP